jgi:RNA polymerase sigma factor for flagellar operon FliA
MKKKDEMKLWKDFDRDRSNLSLRNELVNYYMPLVRLHARKVMKNICNRIEFNDLVSYGVFGLVEAIERFDLQREKQFGAFAALRIRGSIYDEIRKNDIVSRLSRRRLNNAQKAKEKLEQKNGKIPFHHEIAKELDISEEQLKTIYEGDLDQVNLDVAFDSNFFEFEIKNQPMPDERLEKIDFFKNLTRGLSQREKKIIFLFYYKKLSMKEIGEILSLSDGRISQIHHDVMIFLYNKYKTLFQDGEL